MLPFSAWCRIVIGILVSLAFLLMLYFFFVLIRAGVKSPVQSYIDYKFDREREVYNEIKFNLVDPTEAPKGIRDLVLLGYQLMINTKIYAPEYVGGKMSCTNCHFAGGNTTGGAQNAISLAGVATKYPSYDSIRKRVIDLPARINGCFSRSMNGKPLPRESYQMLALVTYFQWISKGLPIYENITWLGLEPLKTKHLGDFEQGKRVYHIYCATCHRENGEGGPSTPPLWGDNSFNEGAGFNRQELLASFIYWNMPYHDNTPVLSEEEAMDVATYILSHPRPKYHLE